MIMFPAYPDFENGPRDTGGPFRPGDSSLWHRLGRSHPLDVTPPPSPPRRTLHAYAKTENLNSKRGPIVNSQYRGSALAPDLKNPRCRSSDQAWAESQIQYRLVFSLPCGSLSSPFKSCNN